MAKENPYKGQPVEKLINMQREYSNQVDEARELAKELNKELRKINEALSDELGPGEHKTAAGLIVLEKKPARFDRKAAEEKYRPESEPDIFHVTIDPDAAKRALANDPDVFKRSKGFKIEVVDDVDYSDDLDS